MRRRHDYSAEADLRARVREEPTAAGPYLRLAAWLSRAGRFEQAREVLRTGLTAAREPARLEHLLGLLLAETGDWAAAERHLESALRRDPANFTALRDLALVRGATGRPAEAVATLRQAAGLAGTASTGLEWLLRLGERVLVGQGERPERRPPQPARRAAVVENLVERDPEVAEALLPMKGGPAPESRQTLRAARRALSRLAAKHPTYPDLHFGLGLVAERLGEMDRAIEAAEEALQINPRYAEAALLAVRLYEKSGRTDDAADQCRKVTELRPEWVDAHVRLGRLLRVQGRNEEAADAYRRAVALNAECEEARDGLLAVAAVAGGEGGQP